MPAQTNGGMFTASLPGKSSITVSQTTFDLPNRNMGKSCCENAIQFNAFGRGDSWLWFVEYAIEHS